MEPAPSSSTCRMAARRGPGKVPAMAIRGGPRFAWKDGGPNSTRPPARPWVMGTDGAGAKLFHVPHVGSAAPWQAPGNGDPRGATVSMQGRPLFRFASQRGTDMLLETCAKAGI